MTTTAIPYPAKAIPCAMLCHALPTPYPMRDIVVTQTAVPIRLRGPRKQRRDLDEARHNGHERADDRQGTPERDRPDASPRHEPFRPVDVHPGVMSR